MIEHRCYIYPWMILFVLILWVRFDGPIGRNGIFSPVDKFLLTNLGINMIRKAQQNTIPYFSKLFYDFSLNSIQNNSTFSTKYPPSHPTPHLHHYDYYGEQLAAREEDWPLCQTSPANSDQPQNHQRTHDQPQNHKRTHVQPQIHHWSCAQDFLQNSKSITHWWFTSKPG